MPKKYGKNNFVLRGYLTFSAEGVVGIDNIPLGKALMNIPGREDKVMKIPIEGLGEIVKHMKANNDRWVEVEGRIEGREYEGKYYASIKIFELKTLPMHKEENSEETPPPEVGQNEDVPF